MRAEGGGRWIVKGQQLTVRGQEGNLEKENWV